MSNFVENLLSAKDRALINKYTNGFMYTDYPHKSVWSEDFGDEDYRVALRSLFLDKTNPPVLLYVHIPFCPKLCYFCLCNKIVTRDYNKVTHYLNFLYREIDLLHDFFQKNSIKPNFREIHIGGGCPTVLKKREFDQLMEKIQSIVDINKLSEFAIEIDPRTVAGKKETMKYYHSKGIDRISIGVQDFDPDVQKKINRIQPRELIEDILSPDIRKDFKSVNFDILIGLPGQTMETFRKTIDTIIELSPDRIDFAFFNYAQRNHPHMKLLKTDGCLNNTERHMLFVYGCKTFVRNGYGRIGFDHFAKPTDNLAKAMKNKALSWNSLGYRPGKCQDMIGVGVHSGSRITANYYFQNVYSHADYEAAITKGKFPIYRGFKLNKDDLIRRDIINEIRSYLVLEPRSIEAKYNIDFKKYFSAEKAVLDEFAKDGVVELNDSNIAVTELGKPFCNLVCRIFDNYNRNINFPRDFFLSNRSKD